METAGTIFLVAALLLVSQFILISSEEVEEEKEFDYERGSTHGPERWGDMHTEWAQCKTGSMQSPINLIHEKAEMRTNSGDLEINYKPDKVILRNRGHDIMLKWVEDAGYIEINGTEYKLDQCHWHLPSEHTINGRRFDAEAHLVHESRDKKLSVISIMYQIGKPDAFISELMEPIKSISICKEVERDVGILDPRHMVLGADRYYRYIGSLTIPPCTEGIIWNVIQTVRTISKEQLQQLRDAVHDFAEFNARPVQPLNNRAVNFYSNTQQS